jgi:hypothetical protein
LLCETTKQSFSHLLTLFSFQAKQHAPHYQGAPWYVWAPHPIARKLACQASRFADWNVLKADLSLAPMAFLFPIVLEFKMQALLSVTSRIFGLCRPTSLAAAVQEVGILPNWMGLLMMEETLAL